MITQTIEITYNGPNVAPDFSSTELGTTADQSTTRFYAEPQEGDVWDVVFNVPMDYLVPGKLAYPFIRVDADGYAVVPGAIMSRIHDDHVNVHVRITHIDDTVEASAPVNMHVVTLANTPVEASTTGLLMVRGGSWTWQEDVAYEVASFVEYDGLIWRAAEPSQGEPPSEDTEYWVHVGTPGPQGEQGVQGFSISAEQTGEYGLTIHTTDPDGQDVVYQSLRGQQGIQGVQGYSISATKTGDYGLTISTDDPSGQDVVYDSLRGEQGQQGIQGIQGYSVSAEKTGAYGLTITSTDPSTDPVVYDSLRGEQGPRGEAFTIDKTYPSIQDMEDDFETTTVTNGHFVVIDTGDVEDEDNGKLYLKTEIEWQYITDLSGMQGMTGPQGPKGETGDTGPRGFSISATKTGDYGLTISSTDPSQSDVVYSSLRGEQGAQGVQGVQGLTGPRGYSLSATQTGDYGLTIHSEDPDEEDVVYESLRGAQGEQGIQGVQGIQGIQGLTGPRGYSISAEKSGDYGLIIQSTDPTAEDVIYASLRGEQGQQGVQGPAGPTGPQGQGLPAGGQIDFILKKASNEDYDYAWVAQGTAPVTSVNSKQGAVVLTTSDLVDDVGYELASNKVTTMPTNPTDTQYASAKLAKSYTDTQVASKSKVEVSASGTSTTKIGYIKVDGTEYALNGGVTSVNGQTGVVSLTIPDDTADLTNGAGFQTASDVSSAVSAEATDRNEADLILQGQIDALGNTYEVKSNKVTSMGNSPTDVQYPSAKLVKDFVNSSINAYASYYITKNAAGQPFATVEELDDATVYYSGGEVREPTRNDYCIVLVDDVNGDGNSTRYIYNSGWEFQYVFNYQFSNDQINALNSGITSTLVGKYEGYETSKANVADLKAVATTGSYNDLTNKPTIPAAQVQSDWSATSGMGVILNKPSLATVATSGSYNDLSNKPSIPSAQVQTDWNATSGMGQILNKPELATVATTGSYNNLSDKPTIPVAGTDYLTPSAISTGYVAKDGSKVLSDVNFSTTYKSKLDGIAAGAEVNVQSDWTQTVSTADDYIKNKPTLATVATTGAYGDLSGKPTIPVSGTDFLSPSAIENAYVKKETGKGLTSNDFTSTYKTKLDGIAAGAEVNVQSNWTQTDTTADDFIKNKPTIPTNTNQLTNGAGFITSSGSITGSSGSCTGNAATATTATNYASSGGIATALSGKQPTLVSGTNIKTVNGNSLLGSGNITIQSGGVTDVTLNGTSIVSGGVANLTAADVRKIIVSDQPPSSFDLPDGTIWLQY